MIEEMGTMEQKTAFQKWWNENKHGVCFDIVRAFRDKKLTINDPEVELRLMHVAFQGWLAATLEYDIDTEGSKK